MQLFFVFGPVVALMLVAYNFYSFLKKPEGTERMREISICIRKGADAFITTNTEQLQFIPSLSRSSSVS
ncbi:Inorganic H+ pyrophosphatase [Fervidobacterium changbaicum]|nr:Inorganic H+ pyrophosphatase [Fervidobacterium changbaicum]